MANILACTVLLMLAHGISAESTVTLKHGSIKVNVPVNATKAQQQQALLEAFSAQEAELANTVTNAISTHQWSLMAEEFGDPESKVKGDTPKVETWFLADPKSEDKAHCMEKQLKKAGFAGYRFEVCGKEDLKEMASGPIDMDIKQLPQHQQKLALQNWCSHKRLFDALEQAQDDSQPDYFLVLEDDAAVHETNLKPMVEFLIKDLSDPRIAMFSGVQNWDFIQLDPYGGIASPVGFIQGRPLYKPSSDMVGADRGAYQGSHAFLIKRSAIKKINKLMKDSKVTLVEKLVQKMPEFIAVGSGVAMNKNSPFFAASTTSNSCKESAAKKDTDLLSTTLSENAKKAWWFPREEPKDLKKSQHEHHAQEKAEAKAEAKHSSSFLR